MKARSLISRGSRSRIVLTLKASITSKSIDLNHMTIYRMKARALNCLKYFTMIIGEEPTLLGRMESRLSQQLTLGTLNSLSLKTQIREDLGLTSYKLFPMLIQKK